MPRLYLIALLLAGCATEREVCTDCTAQGVHAAGYADAIAVRAMRLAHDNDPEVEDAEGLSFLSLESAGSTRRDVTAIAAALRPQARAKVALIHLTPQVRHWLFESIAA